MNLSGLRRWRWRAVWIGLIVCCTAGAIIGSRRPFDRLPLDVALQQAAIVADRSEIPGVPLPRDSSVVVRSAAAVLPAPPRLDLAARLAELAGSDPDRSSQAIAMAELLDGKADWAVARLNDIPAARRNAAIWTTIAAA